MQTDQEKGEADGEYDCKTEWMREMSDISNSVVVVRRYMRGREVALGGGTRNVMERVNALRLLGFEVVLVHSGREAITERTADMGTGAEVALPDLFDAHPVRWLWPARQRRHRKACNQFLEILARLKPRAVMVHGAKPMGVYRAACRLAPVYFFRHDGFLACPAGSRVIESDGAKPCRRKVGLGCVWRRCWRRRSVLYKLGNLILSLWDLRCLKKMEHVVTSSRYLAAIHGVPEADVQYPPLRSPADMPNYKPNCQRTTRRVVFVGRLDRYKGTEELIPIMRLLPADYSLVVVGDGPARRTLEEHARPLADRIEFRGWQSSEETFNELMRAEVAIVPSMWDEGFGIVGPEAFACGTPVVAYNSGGIAEWCIPPAGILVSHGDRKAAAHAIQDVCEARRGTTWTDRSRAARDLALGPFGYDRFLAAIMRMLDVPEARRCGVDGSPSARLAPSPGFSAPAPPA